MKTTHEENKKIINQIIGISCEVARKNAILTTKYNKLDDILRSNKYFNNMEIVELMDKIINDRIELLQQLNEVFTLHSKLIDVIYNP